MFNSFFSFKTAEDEENLSERDSKIKGMTRQRSAVSISGINTLPKPMREWRKLGKKRPDSKVFIREFGTVFTVSEFVDELERYDHSETFSEKAFKACKIFEEIKHFYNQKILHESTTSTTSSYEDAFKMSGFSHKALKKHRLTALKDALENHIVEDFLVVKELPEEGTDSLTADLALLARGPELKLFTISLASTTLLHLLKGNNLLGGGRSRLLCF